ncbi:MAG: metallophosphoesterase [Salibacteraceae bacterium]
MNYDILGDIHGQYSKLKDVLKRLGYKKSQGVYSQKGHKAIFVGDLIDRGDGSSKVVQLVKDMVESGNAEAIMGNHEYNWIGYNTIFEKKFLRTHSPKNNKQVRETIKSYQGKPELLQEHLNWLSNLPIFIEKKKFRVAHACWDQSAVDYYIKQSRKFSKSELILESYKPRKKLKGVLKTLLAGPELSLPNGVKIEDTDGTPRVNFRYKWWLNVNNKSCRDLALKYPERVPDIPVKSGVVVKDRKYNKSEKPLFIGHYSLQGKPKLMRKNICCLDWVEKTNRIAVYRFKGEGKLDSENLVFYH